MLVLVAILVALAAGAASGADSQPTKVRRAVLDVANVQPFTVTGHRFRAKERIRVSADSSRKTVRASARGGFVVRFAAVDPCNGVSITAVGDKGSRASLAFNAGWRLHCASP